MQNGWSRHAVLRWLVLFWYVFASHAPQVRRAVLESGDIFSPCPHVGWSVHDVLRCSAALSKVLTGQALQVRWVVLESGDICSPAAQNG